MGTHTEGCRRVRVGLGNHTEGCRRVREGLGTHTEGCRRVREGLGTHTEGCHLNTATRRQGHPSGDTSVELGPCSTSERTGIPCASSRGDCFHPPGASHNPRRGDQLEAWPCLGNTRGWPVPGRYEEPGPCTVSQWCRDRPWLCTKAADIASGLLRGGLPCRPGTSSGPTPPHRGSGAGGRVARKRSTSPGGGWLISFLSRGVRVSVVRWGR